MKHADFLSHRRFRFLKAALGLGVLAWWIDWFGRDAGAPGYGGSVAGYALGIASAVLMAVLLWYGVRKRRTPRFPDRRQARSGKDQARPQDRRKQGRDEFWRYGGTLRGWLSAHVYLGGLLLLTSLLHAGFRLGGSLHGLAGWLVLLVSLSGLYGVYAYRRYPAEISRLYGDADMNIWQEDLRALNRQLANRVKDLQGETAPLLQLVQTGGQLQVGLISQLFSSLAPCATTAAIACLEARLGDVAQAHEAEVMREIYAQLLKKQRLLAQMRQVVSLEARMNGWLFVHAPLAVLTFVAMLLHVVVVMSYW